MPWSPEQPYNDLPGLPPAVELETPSVLRALIAARQHRLPGDSPRQMTFPIALLARGHVKEVGTSG